MINKKLNEIISNTKSNAHIENKTVYNLQSDDNSIYIKTYTQSHTKINEIDEKEDLMEF